MQRNRKTRIRDMCQARSALLLIPGMLMAATLIACQGPADVENTAVPGASADRLTNAGAGTEWPKRPTDGAAHLPLVSRKAAVPSGAASMAAALDIPTGMLVNSSYTGSDRAAGAVGSLGIIKPVKGSSFVLLSTGDLASLGPKGVPYPEPGTDFGAQGMDGDAATLGVVVNVPQGVNRFTFSYDFLSTESPEWVGSQYNDEFRVRVTEPSGAVGNWHSIATVNSSHFFEVSDSRALDTGFNIFSDDPSGVDHAVDFENSTAPKADAGLTGFQTATIAIPGGGNHAIEFQIYDAGDGVLDSAVLIDRLSFGIIETVDAAPDIVDDKGQITTNRYAFVRAARTATGVVADGVSRLLVRTQVSGPGNVEFSLSGGSAPADGSLSLPGSTLQAATVTASAVDVEPAPSTLTARSMPSPYTRLPWISRGPASATTSWPSAP
jgi:hypothetical protein